MPSKNFKSLVPNVVCLCILVLGCILFIYLCLELNAYTRFQEGSAEICQIIEIPPFIEPQSGAQQCCYIDIDPLVLNVIFFMIFLKALILFVVGKCFRNTIVGIS